MYIYPGEKTASIRIYAETQSFYDFGRCTGGDVIRLWSHVRDVDSWTALLDEVEKIADKVISQYTGKLTGLEKGYFGNDGESMSIKVYAEGTFLNNYERQYEKQTIEDVRISHISKEDFSALEAEKKKKAENQPVELINVDKVNIGAKPANSDSPAAKYTKAYSVRMSTVNPEFE